MLVGRDQARAGGARVPEPDSVPEFTGVVRPGSGELPPPVPNQRMQGRLGWAMRPIRVACRHGHRGISSRLRYSRYPFLSYSRKSKYIQAGQLRKHYRSGNFRHRFSSYNNQSLC